ncbi:MAG: hypothetical protein H0V56_04175, partial [Chthoniobacterales bacterium]|nr:hypothetical protein [Chthoniobacterales bacterium]
AIFDPRKLALCTVLLAGAVWFVTLPPAAGEPALWSVNDYKTARRQIFAGDFARGEVRLRRAFASMVAPGQISVGVANGFAEVAQEQAEAGDPAAALRTIHYGIRINPASERLRDLQQRIVAGSAAQPRSSTKRPLDRPD